MKDLTATTGRSLFIQGLPRSRTTYFWSKFRDDLRNFCFYEPLHPLLIDQRPRPSAVVPASSLRHPRLNKFIFAEYPETVSAPVDLGIKRYFLKESENVPELEEYFQGLINLATGRPVFKLVRLALRGNWLAQKFPGIHIYLDRNLSELVNSYYSFRGEYSWYLHELITVVGANAESEVFGELAAYLDLPQKEGNYQQLRDSYRKLALSRFSMEEYSRQKMVDMVAFFRELALLQARKYATLIVTLEDFLNYRGKLEEVVLQLTGTKVDFSDFKGKSGIAAVSPSPVILKIIKRAKLKTDI